MKLAILVVYLVPDDQERLLDIHWNRIERHTAVPYTIFGSVNRLSSSLRHKVEARGDTRAFEFPPTEQRGSNEHSYYLERLLPLALEDGATHIAILHVDSFPVADAWVEILARKLSPSRLFATIENINTACLLFDRDFLLRHRPTLLLPAERQRGPEYEAYVRDCQPNLHSGIGYGFTAYQMGAGWYSLLETARTGDAGGPAIYDDLLFHLKGAVRLGGAREKVIASPLRRLGSGRFEALLSLSRKALPEAVRLSIRSLMRRPLHSLIDDSRVQWQREQMANALQQLLEDPDGYIERLRRS